MTGHNGGWLDILTQADAEALWAKLFHLVSKHSATRNLMDAKRMPHDRVRDLHTDLTQDLYLRLYQKDRWQYYLDARYTDKDIEHELYHIEIPNLVSLLLRERHPEAYRMARRISTLIRTRSEFRHFPASYDSSGSPAKRRLIFQVYGLREWPQNKRVISTHEMHELIKDVHCRNRDTRRAGRGSGSQIIISNAELVRLIVDVYRAIDSTADIGIIRSLVLSKLAVEDSQFVSIDARVDVEGGINRDPIKIDFADQRPTPEALLLEKETIIQIDKIATGLLERMKDAVLFKPRRYRRLAQVAYHCYFDAAAPSQSKIARLIGISDSLVSHYRKLFDSIIQNVKLNPDDYIIFLSSFSAMLKSTIAELGQDCCTDLRVAGDSPSPVKSLRAVSSKSMAHSAASFR